VPSPRAGEHEPQPATPTASTPQGTNGAECAVGRTADAPTPSPLPSNKISDLQPQTQGAPSTPPPSRLSTNGGEAAGSAPQVPSPRVGEHKPQSATLPLRHSPHPPPSWARRAPKAQLAAPPPPADLPSISIKERSKKGKSAAYRPSAATPHLHPVGTELCVCLPLDNM
jgi:hypothetical protein